MTNETSTKERQPTDDEIVGMAWWNSLTETERVKWCDLARTAVPAEAWAEYKRQAAAITACVSEEEMLRIWRETFGSYDEQPTVSFSRNAVRVGLISWAVIQGTPLTPYMVEAILAHIENAEGASQIKSELRGF